MKLLYENDLRKTPEGDNIHELILPMLLLLMLLHENHLAN